MYNQDKHEYVKNLQSPSPLQGRENEFSNNIGRYLSESALYQKRAIVQLQQIKFLSQKQFKYMRKLSAQEEAALDKMIGDISNNDAARACLYDHYGVDGVGPFEHDVKAIEYVVRDKLKNSSMSDLVEFVHFPFTSEDVSNIAYNLMIRDAVKYSWLPAVLKVTDELATLSENLAYDRVLGMSHGQPASPTTMGKRFAYFLNNIVDSIETLMATTLDAKCSSTVGNHNAIYAIYPEFDYEQYAEEFVESFGFEYQNVANQRNNHQRIVRVLNGVKAINTTLYDLCENVWLNVSNGWLTQVANETHVGSSIMPYKINPWFFEVAEGYTQISNSLISGAEQGLCVSRFERDLSDHPWERMYGEMFGYSIVAAEYISRGLKRLVINKEKCRQDINSNPKVISEVIQVAGRMLGSDNPYMKLKEITRGKEITLNDLRQVIDCIITDDDIKNKLLCLNPGQYVGIASKLALNTVDRYTQMKENLND